MTTTREIKEKVIKLYEEGKTAQQIKEATGVTRGSQSNILSEVGLRNKSIQVEGRAKWMYCSCSIDSKWVRFDDLPMEIQIKYYKKAESILKTQWADNYLEITGHSQLDILEIVEDREDRETSLLREIQKLKEENEHLKALLMDQWKEVSE